MYSDELIVRLISVLVTFALFFYIFILLFVFVFTWGVFVVENKRVPNQNIENLLQEGKKVFFDDSF